MPSHNQEGWREKFARNKARDAATEEALAALGLTVLVVWECEVKDQLALREKLSHHLR